MSETTIWIVVAVVVVLAVLTVAALLMKANKRKQEQRRLHAQELRAEAHTHTGAVTESQRDAQLKAAEAERARIEAARAEEQAAAARQAAQVAEARVEDRVREADRIDPDVDHRSGDYTPQAPSTGTHPTQHDTVAEPTQGHTPRATPTEPTTAPPTDGTTTPGSHRA